MKEFIFIWSIENISYSWHKAGEKIRSPTFFASFIQNSSWQLELFPRGDSGDYFSLFLVRLDGGRQLSVNFELSCISTDNSPLMSCTFPESDNSFAGNGEFGHPRFLNRHEIFYRKNLYMPRDVLTLRCRMWKDDCSSCEFGKSFGRTCLQIDRIFLAESINPEITETKTIYVQSKRSNISLISISMLYSKDSMRVVIKPKNYETIKFSVLKLFVMEKCKDRILYEHTSSWLDKIRKETWTLPLLSEVVDVGNGAMESRIEFVYSTGEDITQLTNDCPYLSEHVSKYVISCIPSGNLPDCQGIAQSLWNLHDEQVLCDLELQIQNTSVFVHKAVLCARSPVFLTMLTGDMKEKRKKCIKIEDIVSDILKKFLLFIYTDSFENLEWESVFGLYYAADKYQVERLKILCCSYLLKNVNFENVSKLLMLADKHNDLDLKKRVNDFILENDEKVFSSPSWKQFGSQHSLLALNTMLLKYDKEQGTELPTETYEEKLSKTPDLVDDLRTLYQDAIFSDMIIKTKNSEFRAHKFVLCANFLVLKETLANYEKNRPTCTLNMEDLDEDTVSRMLLFLYTDSLEGIEWELAVKLYRAANAYGIEKLKIKSSCFLLENLGIPNASDLLILAHQHNDDNLKVVVEDFIFVHDEEIFGSDEWAEFSKTNLQLANETMCLKYRKRRDFS